MEDQQLKQIIMRELPGILERCEMAVKELEIVAQGNLVVDRETLKAAGLGERLRLVIQEGEIRILPETSPDPRRMLDELAGCLGQEPAAEYNFDLKIGGLYEARRWKTSN